MHARPVMIVFMFLLFSVMVLSSCGDRSVVGTAQSENSGAQPRRLVEVEADPLICNEMICCIAINESGNIVWLETYDSTDELSFSVPDRQMETWDTYGVAVIDVYDLDSDFVHASSIDETLRTADRLLLMTVTSSDLDDVPWHCIKYCAGSGSYGSCILACMGKRPKSSGSR